MCPRVPPVPAAGGLAVALLAVAALPVTGQPAAPQEPALPSGGVVIDVDAAEEQVFVMGIPDLLGDAGTGREGGDILRNDFRLMPGYRVVSPATIQHDVVAEGLAIRPAAWGALDANGVIKGQVTLEGDELVVELRFFRVGGDAAPELEASHRGPARRLRRWLHDFGNEVLRVLTGRAGPFGTHIAYARKHGPGRKDVYCAHMDGYGERRFSSGVGLSLLPAFGPGNIWFTRMTETGMFITHGRAQDRRIIGGDGLNMSPSICDGRVYFASSRQGNSEIYSAALDGSDVRRLTDHPDIDVSPACSPRGEIAFVSNRHGSPQIFVMNADGSDVRRVTFRGSHNQTPAWCPDPDRRVLAFTGRDDGLDVFIVNIASQDYVRVTQGQGQNKDPAFSPDCRLVAFSSDRRSGPGVYLASPSGAHQTRVIEGTTSTVRWAAPRPPSPRAP